MSSRISESTTVSLSLIGAVLGALVGAAVFITKINIQTNANATTIGEIKNDTKQELKEIKAELKEIRSLLQKGNK